MIVLDAVVVVALAFAVGIAVAAGNAAAAAIVAVVFGIFLDQGARHLSESLRR